MNAPRRAAKHLSIRSVPPALCKALEAERRRWEIETLAPYRYYCVAKYQNTPSTPQTDNVNTIPL